MRKYSIFLFCLFLSYSYSQELTIPTFTQYLGDNPAIISPAYMGIGDFVKIRVNGLTQWVGIKGAPDNQSISIDGRLGQRSGFGAFAYNDKNGNTYQKGAKLSFAHHLILDYNDDKYLSFGMSFVMNNFEIDISKFDPGFDPSVVSNKGLTNYNFDVGFLYRQKSLDLTVNANNILNKNLDGYSKIEPNKLRNYTAFSSYTFSKSGSNVEFEPSVFYQFYESDKRSVSDINFKVRFLQFESYYWAGVTYRFLNDQIGKPLNIGPMAGLKKNKFYFAYSYQVTMNSLFGYNSGTHMVTLGLDVFENMSNCPCTQKFSKMDSSFRR